MASRHAASCPAGRGRRCRGRPASCRHVGAGRPAWESSGVIRSNSGRTRRVPPRSPTVRQRQHDARDHQRRGGAQPRRAHQARDPHRGQDRAAPPTSIRPAWACCPATAGRSPAPALLRGCSSGSRSLPGKDRNEVRRSSVSHTGEREAGPFGCGDVEGGLLAPTHGCEARSAPVGEELR
jgi:hypothetical protein